MLVTPEKMSLRLCHLSLCLSQSFHLFYFRICFHTKNLLPVSPHWAVTFLLHFLSLLLLVSLNRDTASPSFTLPWAITHHTCDNTRDTLVSHSNVFYFDTWDEARSEGIQWINLFSRFITIRHQLRAWKLIHLAVTLDTVFSLCRRSSSGPINAHSLHCLFQRKRIHVWKREEKNEIEITRLWQCSRRGQLKTYAENKS